jgi:hypothetical protein
MYEVVRDCIYGADPDLTAAANHGNDTIRYEIYSRLGAQGTGPVRRGKSIRKITTSVEARSV